MTTDDKLDKLMEDVSDIKIETSGMAVMVKAHEKDLDGNGQLGVKDRLTIVEEKQKSCVAIKGHARANALFAISLIMCGLAIFSAIITWIK